MTGLLPRHDLTAGGGSARHLVHDPDGKRGRRRRARRRLAGQEGEGREEKPGNPCTSRAGRNSPQGVTVKQALKGTTVQKGVTTGTPMLLWVNVMPA